MRLWQRFKTWRATQARLKEIRREEQREDYELDAMMGLWRRAAEPAMAEGKVVRGSVTIVDGKAEVVVEEVAGG